MLTLNAIRLPNLHHMSNVSVIRRVLISQHYDIKFSQSTIQRTIVFFNRDSAEPKGSANGIQGFRGTAGAQ